MAEKGAQGGDNHYIRSIKATYKDRTGAFATIQDKCEGGETLAPGSQDVRCPDIARPDISDITQPGEFGENQAERNRANKITSGEGAQ